MILAVCLGIWAVTAFTQYDKTTALVHTKLDLRFDYKKCYLYGKEWLTAMPYAYPTDSVQLDAKGMDIKEVSLQQAKRLRPLQYRYDGLKLSVKLDRTYSSAEQYTLYIDYTAKPNELQGRRKEEKGLYFINPDSSENKPVQIWTEGEPENASVWFPTIDNPNQKTTEEISMTVPAKYTTLSNGYLATQKNNADGTRTDTWKMDKPNAPYLFVMVVGDFKIYKQQWRGKEVSYYLEPQYAPYAKDIFGQTPESISFFSRITGVEFPWNKYSQVVVRDYVSGAMENTTATMMGEPMQGTTRELADRYYQTGIQHELFHQWFGDYVTAKNWANLCMNESFADLGELLWLEYKYGADAAGEHWYQGLQGYLGDTANYARPLVNYAIQQPRDAFNGVTYQKGGRILYMLRDYLGRDVFYKGLHGYLTQHAYKNADADQLRIAMEEASGKDLVWFFKQWFYHAGHPELDIHYTWNESVKTETVVIKQTQTGAAFRIPLAIDIYTANGITRQQVWLAGKQDTLRFALASQPLLVNVDANKTLVGQKTDHKTINEWLYQFAHAPLFMDRSEALDAAAANMDNDTTRQILVDGLRDSYPGIRSKVLYILTRKHEDIRNTNAALRNMCLPSIAHIAARDSNTLVQAKAINTLSVLNDSTYLPLFIQALQSVSYEVQGAALNAISQVSGPLALQYARQYEKDNLGALTQSMAKIYAAYGGENEWAFVFHRFTHGTLQEKIHLVQNFAAMTGRISNPALARQGIKELRDLAIKYKKFGAGSFIQGFLHKIKTQREGMHDEALATMAENAIQSIEVAPVE